MASARACCREPMLTSTPALAQRNAMPGPCSPVPPKMLTITLALPLLTKQIPLWSADQLRQTAFPGRVIIAADHRDRHVIQLVHDQLSRRGQFVGHRQGRHSEFVTLRIELPDVALDRLHAREANSDIDYAVPPGAPKGIGDNHCHCDP